MKKMKVLYENSDILAIDKPSGILVHPATEQARNGAGSDQKTIMDIFRKKYPKLEIVHRLDRETSGVLLLAKNKKAYEFLKRQFSASALGLKTKSGLADRQDRIKKTYVAIVNGYVKNDHGVINKPIGRSPKDFRRRLAGRGARGEMREAVTEYKVLKRFEAPCAQNTLSAELFTYLELCPKTGRTHQIRAHMKYINHPIACDNLYNPNGQCPKGLSRLALHAHKIEFKNPKGEIVKVESPIPKEFKKITNK